MSKLWQEDMKKGIEEESVVIRREILNQEPVYLRGWDWKRHNQRGSGRGGEELEIHIIKSWEESVCQKRC